MLTEKEMELIFQNEIPLEGLTIDSGIYEFHEDKGKSIGVSYERLGDTPAYIFNIFIGDEYINISEAFWSIYDAVKAVTEEWNKW